MKNIKNIIEDAEIVLIGIGYAFQYNGFDEELMKIFEEKKGKEKLGEEVDWLLSFLRSYSCQNCKDIKLQNAYEHLFQLAKDKNYFVVTLSEDDIIFQSGFDKDKITAPCGSMRRLQCVNGCQESMKESEVIVNHIINEIKDPDKKLREIDRPCCETCGGHLVFNTAEQENYIESGYMKSWEKYRMWLTGTLNRKICLLELGTNFRYPSIIRWAFEKIAFINEKATFIRINENYPQFTEELKGKAYAYHENPVEFFQ